MMTYEGEDQEGFVVKIRGLPWSAGQDEILSFMNNLNIVGGRHGVHLTYTKDGRPSGEAYVELSSQEDVEKAVARNKDHMGKRYIEVFQSKRSEMDWVVKRSGPGQQNTNSNTDAVVRLRGLPFGCSKEEVAHFFSGLEIVPNGITLMHDSQGRSTGDAFVQFASQDIAENAQRKHKEKIGHRYIEIFKSSLHELRNQVGARNMGRGMGRPGPYDRMDRFGMGGGGGMGGGMNYGRGRGRSNIKGFYDDSYDEFGGGNFNDNMGGGMGMNMGGMGRRGGGMGDGMGHGGMGRGGRFGMGGGMKSGGMDYQSSTGHTVHMRGLPFQASEDDILTFFKPLEPVSVTIHYNNDGRASGKADVDFTTHQDAQSAMSKDHNTMQHRYIELFLKSTAGRGGSGYGGGYGGGRGGYGGGNMGGTNYTAF